MVNTNEKYEWKSSSNSFEISIAFLSPESKGLTMISQVIISRQIYTVNRTCMTQLNERPKMIKASKVLRSKKTNG